MTAPSNAPRLPDLELIRVIGSGSYGDVWLARTVTGLYRAVKVVSRDRFKDAKPWLREFSGITRFQRDMGGRARQLALLHVGNDEAQGLFFYVMELADDLVAGPDIDPANYQPATLKAVKERQPKMPLDEVLRLGIELARALAELHDAGLIHRDVKPSNIVFIGGAPKLADLGLVSSTEHSITSLGTPGYSPPDGTGTPRSDVFSLGKILYELAMNRPSSDFPSLPAELASSPDSARYMELNEALLKACHPEPSQRFSGASEFLEQLILVQAGGSLREMARMRERLRKARRAFVWLGTAAAIVGLAFGLKHYQTTLRLARTESEARTRAEADARLARYTTDLQLAQLGYEASNLGAQREALRNQIPKPGQADLRGPEWWLLWNKARGDETRRWTPDGPRGLNLANIPGVPGKLAWQTRSGTGLCGILNMDTGVSTNLRTGVLGSPSMDKKGRLFTSTPEKSILEIDIDTGRQVTWPEAAGSVLGGIDTRLLTLRYNTQGFAVTVWDTDNRSPIFTWQTPASAQAPGLIDACLSDDGQLLGLFYISGGSSRQETVQVLEIPSGKQLLQIEDRQYTQCLSFSHDGARLAVGGGGWLQLYDLRSKTLLWQREDIRGDSLELRWSPDDRLLVNVGNSQLLQLRNSKDGSVSRSIRAAEADMTSLAWSEDGRYLRFAQSNGVVREVDLKEAPKSTMHMGGFYTGSLIDWLPTENKDQILVPWADGQLSLTDLREQSRLSTWQGALLPLAKASKGKGWFALGLHNELLFCPEGKGALRAEPTGLSLDKDFVLTAYKCSQDGSMALLLGTDGRLELWDLNQTLCQARFTIPKALMLSDAVFLHKNTQAVISNNKGQLFRLSVGMQPELKQTIELDLPASTLTVDSAGHVLGVGLEDGRIKFLDAASGTQLSEFQAHQGRVFSLQFDHTGNRLLSSGNDGNLLFWEPRSARLIAASAPGRLTAQTIPIPLWNIRLSDDESRLSILGQGGRFWQLELDRAEEPRR